MFSWFLEMCDEKAKEITYKFRPEITFDRVFNDIKVSKMFACVVNIESKNTYSVASCFEILFIAKMRAYLQRWGVTLGGS